MSRIEIAVVNVFDPIRAGCSESADRRPVAAIVRCCFVLLLLLSAVPWAIANESAQPATGPGVLEVFVRDGCPHCADAKEFLPAFSSERPWLQIVYRSVDRDKTARNDLERHSRDSGNWPPGVPTFLFSGQVLVGFESPERTGPKLAELVEGHATIPGGIETGAVRYAHRC